MKLSFEEFAPNVDIITLEESKQPDRRLTKVQRLVFEVIHGVKSQIVKIRQVKLENDGSRLLLFACIAPNQLL